MIDIVWLYRSPIPVWRRGIIYLFIYRLPSLRLKEGEGGSQHPVENTVQYGVLGTREYIEKLFEIALMGYSGVHGN